MHKNIDATVVVLKPPAVEPGDPPISISIIVTNTETSVRRVKSTDHAIQKSQYRL